jgi:UDP-glucose 4-epimerase
MKILVTGGSGKAGSATVREFAEAGHEVVNIDMSRPKEPLPGGFIKIDLTNMGEVYDAFFQVKPDAVCHLAANPAPGGDARQTVFTNNTLSTYHTMQAAGDCGAKRFIYASSEMATGWLTTKELPPVFPFNETHRADTPNAYALSKYLGEVIADSMVCRYPQMGFVSLRINNVISPDSYHWLEDRRNDYPNGGSGNFWSYIDSRDVASAFRVCAEGATTGHEVFIIAAADTCIDVHLKKALLDRYGAEAIARLDPNHGDFATVYDCRKIEKMLGWKAKHSWRDPKIAGV